MTNVKLTTTQHSALGDLQRFGFLIAGLAPLDRGTPFGFSQRTLDALVAAGHARHDVVEVDDHRHRRGIYPGIVPVKTPRTSKPVKVKF